MKKTIAIQVLLLALVWCVMMGAATSAMAAEEIKIGLISPLTGQVSTFGQSVKDSVVMGVDEINARGGINGMKINLIIVDDKGDPTESANSARYLIDRERVSMIIGPIITPCVMAVAPICQQLGIPMMTPTGTGDVITEIGDFIFRAAYKDSLQGSSMARFARENLNLNTAAIMYDVSSDYSTGVMNAFRETFTELGGKVVSVQSYSEGDSDFSAQLINVAVYSPEALFLPDYYRAVGPILLQAAQFGINSVMLGIDGWDSEELPALSGGFHEGGYFINHYSPIDPRPATVEFRNKFNETFNREPDALAALGYDAILIIEAALKEANSIEAEAIRDALGSVKNIEAATATIDMDPEGTPYKPLVVLQFQNGIPQIVDRVYP